MATPTTLLRLPPQLPVENAQPAIDRRSTPVQTPASDYISDALARDFIDEKGIWQSGGRPQISLSSVDWIKVDLTTPFLKYLVDHFSKKFGAKIIQRQGAYYSLGRPVWEALLEERGINLSLITPEMWSFCTQPPCCFEFWVCLPPAYDGKLDELQDLVIYFMWLQATSSPLSEYYEEALESPEFDAFKAQYSRVAPMTVEMSGTKIIFTQGQVPAGRFHLDNIRLELRCEDGHVVPSELNVTWQSLHDCLIGNLQLTAPLNGAPSAIVAFARYWAHLTTRGAAFNGSELEELLAKTVPFPMEPFIANACTVGLNYIPLSNAAYIAYHFNVWHLPATVPDLRLFHAEKPIEKLLTSHGYYLLRAVLQVIGVLQQGLPLQKGLRCRQVKGASYLEISWEATIVLPLDFENALQCLSLCLKDDREATVSCLSHALEVFTPIVTSLGLPKERDGRLLDIYEALGRDVRFFLLLAHDGRISLDEHVILHLPDQAAKAEGLEHLSSLYSGTRYEHVFNTAQDNVASLESRTPEACRQAVIEALLLCGESQIQSLAWASVSAVEADFLIRVSQELPSAALPFALKHVGKGAEIPLLATYLERLIRQYPETLYLTYGPKFTELLEAHLQQDPAQREQLMPYPHVYVTMDPEPLKSLRKNFPLVTTNLRVWWSHLEALEQKLQENSYEDFDALFLKAFASSPVNLKVQYRFNEIREGVAQRERCRRVDRLITLTKNYSNDVEEVHALCEQVKPAPHEIPSLLDYFYGYYKDRSHQIDGIKRCVPYFAAAGDGRLKLNKTQKSRLDPVPSPAPAPIEPAESSAPEPAAQVVPAVTRKAAAPRVDPNTQKREQIRKCLSKAIVTMDDLHYVLKLLEELPSREWDLWQQLLGRMPKIDLEKTLPGVIQGLIKQLAEIYDHGWRVWLKKHPLHEIKAEDGEYWERAIKVMLERMSSASLIFSNFLTTQALRHIERLEGGACRQMVDTCLKLGIIACWKEPPEDVKDKMHALFTIITSPTVEQKLGCAPVTLLNEEFQNYLHIEQALQPDPALSLPGEEWICKKINSITVESAANQTLFKAYCMTPFLPQDTSRRETIYNWAIKSWGVHHGLISWIEASLLMDILMKNTEDSMARRSTLDSMYESLKEPTSSGPEETRSEFYLRYCTYMFELMPTQDPSILLSMQSALIEFHNQNGYLKSGSTPVCKQAIKAFKRAFPLLLNVYCVVDMSPDTKLTSFTFFRSVLKNHAAKFDDKTRAQLRLQISAHIFSLIRQPSPAVTAAAKVALEDLDACQKYLAITNDEQTQKCVAAFVEAIPHLMGQNDVDVTALVRRIIHNLSAIVWIRLEIIRLVLSSIQDQPSFAAKHPILIWVLDSEKEAPEKILDALQRLGNNSFFHNMTAATLVNRVRPTLEASHQPIERFCIELTAPAVLSVIDTPDHLTIRAIWIFSISSYMKKVGKPSQALLDLNRRLTTELTKGAVELITDAESFQEYVRILNSALDSKDLNVADAMLDALPGDLSAQLSGFKQDLEKKRDSLCAATIILQRLNNKNASIEELGQVLLLFDTLLPRWDLWENFNAYVSEQSKDNTWKTKNSEFGTQFRVFYCTHSLAYIRDEKSCADYSKKLIEVIGSDTAVALAVLDAFPKYAHSFFQNMAGSQLASHFCTVLSGEMLQPFCLAMTDVLEFDPDQNLKIRNHWIRILGKITGSDEITERKKQLTRELVALVRSRFAVADYSKQLFEAIRSSDPDVAQTMLETLPEIPEIDPFRGILQRIIEKSKK
ncbi:MAG: hypothetical protein ABSA17_01185 [Rhabdochlamydiaceae bacterium]